MNVAEAVEYLSTYTAFDWLTKDPGPRKPIWSIVEIQQALRDSGLYPKASTELVRGWVANNEFPAARDAGQMGWRIPREDLLVFFAEARDKKSRNTA